jgi:putative redox protein
MAGITAKWTGGKQFLATDDVGHFVVTDQNGQGFKPPDLLLVALAGCAGIDVASILEKKRQIVSSIEVHVTKQNALDPPWTIEKIELEWVVRGKNLREKAVQDAVWLAEEKYCSVSASLTSELVTNVRIINDEES